MLKYKMMFKSFIKTKFLSITLLILLLAVNAFEIFVFTVGDAEGAPLDAILQFPLVFLAVFMLFAYEFFSKMKRSKAEEFLMATNRQNISIYLSQLLVMISIAAIVAVNLFLLIGFKHILGGNFHFEYLTHVFLVLFLDVFLVEVVGIFIGMFTSIYFNRTISYIVLLIFGFLSSTYPAMFIENPKIYSIYELFNVCMRSLTSTPNSFFGYSIVGYRWLRIFFWISLFCGLCCLKLFNGLRKKLLISCTSLMACGISVFCFYLPWSKVDSAEIYQISELNYYETADIISIEPDFCVTEYEIKLNTLRELNADVKMTLGENSLTDYRFTLYHGYRIKSVTDEKGNELNFERNSDYFTVHSKTPLKIICIKYSGSSIAYYSNMQGIYLSAGFPYYPKPGFGELFNGYTMNPYISQNESLFDIKVNTVGDVCSNIAETENNHFCGQAKDITLVKGFLDCQEIDGIKVMYPYLATDMLIIDNISAETKELTESKFWEEDVKYIFSIFPENLGWYTLTCGNEMEYYGFYQVRKHYDMGFINENKMPIYFCSYSYINDIKTGMDNFEFYLRTEDGDGFANSLKNLEKQFGRDTVVQKLNNYLYNNDDIRTPEEFIADFGGEE